MLVIISPAKTLDFSDNIPVNTAFYIPDFINEANELVGVLQKYSAKKLSDLMSLSDKLAELNYNRFQEFSFDNQNKSMHKQAIFAYKGDVYEGLEVQDYKLEELEFINSNLRIISGLYGLLKPLDLIQPYRLEMGIRLPNDHGKNLYEFWCDKITNKLNQEKGDFIINLASQEYSSSIIMEKLQKQMINIVFKESYKDSYKIVGIHAKKARGVCANYIMRNRIDKCEDIKSFCLNGYKFMPDMSSNNEYIFVR